MGLRLRFNLILSAVLLPGLAVATAVNWQLLEHQTREEVEHNAELMIAAAQAVRGYTVNEVRPLLKDNMHEVFWPQIVPAYAATQTIGNLSDDYHEFAYKEATLNPTNLRDRAVDWEADIVQQFKREADLKIVFGERDTPAGPSLYAASPIRINDEACLACHGTPVDASPAMLAIYGDSNGFGWQLGEIVGAQIVSVPMSVAQARARHVLLLMVGSLAALFALLYIVLNVLLSRLILRPVTDMAAAADQVSTGDFDIPEFPETRSDEIGRLGVSFNRMRRSLEQAIRLISN